MKYLRILALLASLAGVADAHAEAPVRAQTWSLGGAAIASADNTRITMWQSETGISAGLASSSADFADRGAGASGLQTGGFLAWQSSIYRIDATLDPSFDGQTVLGFGASIAESGTRYGVRIGTAWAATDHFTVNPASGLSLADLAAPSSNVNVSLQIFHALSPNLNLIGLAEAQRNFGTSPLEGSYSSGIGRLVVGAGIGYKF